MGFSTPFYDLSVARTTHAASPADLRADDFHAHFAHRSDRLVELVESATGKTVQRDKAASVPTEFRMRSNWRTKLKSPMKTNWASYWKESFSNGNF